jgi:hypothetical protein
VRARLAHRHDLRSEALWLAGLDRDTDIGAPRPLAAATANTWCVPSRWPVVPLHGDGLGAASPWGAT